MQVGVSSRSAGSSIILCLKPGSQTTLLDKHRAAWADLPEDLLVAVINTLRHPRDLLACACVCKAWRKTEWKAFQAMMEDLQDYGGLDRLITLTPIQLAALRDVRMGFTCNTPQSATASVMVLAFICRSLPRLQRLELDWGEPDENWSQVGCTADA